jgi:hypothetical protein
MKSTVAAARHGAADVEDPKGSKVAAVMGVADESFFELVVRWPRWRIIVSFSFMIAKAKMFDC